MKKIEDLKPGDIINIEFGTGGIHKAKVLNNYPEEKKIYLKVNMGWFWIFYYKMIREYDSYNFNNYNILNDQK